MTRKPGAAATIETDRRRLSIALLVLAAAVCAITLPFVNKAFHLDDTVFIRLAEEKLADPLALGLADHGYEGELFPEYLDTHPPLLASYLALLIKVTGGASEAGLHLGFIVFTALAAVSMFFLARRFTDSPLTATLLLLATPGFMVMSQSVMSDVPALSLWLAAIAAYVHGVDQGSRRWLALSGLAIALAVLTTYQSLSLVPLLLLYAILKKRVSAGSLAPLAAAVAVFGAFVVYFFIATGGPPKLSYSIGIITEPSFIAKKVLSIVSVLGGAIIFPVFLAGGMLKGRREYLAFAGLLLLLFIFILGQVAIGEYELLPAILQVVFYAAGLLVIYRLLMAGYDALAAGPRAGGGADNLFLLAWIGGVLLYSVALLPYASTRYLLPLFPPVVLMVVRYARGVFAAARQWRRYAAAAAIFTAVSGLAVAAADYQLAGVYRDFGSSFTREARADGRPVWFSGEFGLRYYLEAGGGRYITSQGDQPAPGDYVVLSHQVIASFISLDLKQRLQLERVEEFTVGWPVRIQDRGSLAGFYGQFHGYLPYSFSRGPVEAIGIYVVKA